MPSSSRNGCVRCGAPAAFGALAPANRLSMHPTARLTGSEEELPLVALRRSDRTVFDAAGGVDVVMQAGWPALRPRRPVEIRLRRKDEWVWVPRHTSGLWTETSKMAAPSFSLPAGAISAGGTCKAAELSSRSGPGFVCDSCYALKANYIYKDVIYAQALRLFWVVDALKSNPTGQVLGTQLAQAIAAAATAGAGQRGRERLHLGIWSGQALQVPGRSGALEIPDAPLPAPFGSERRVLSGTPSGEVAGFFRIHDAGDVMVGPDPALWSAYIAAWCYAATQLPYVHFWMPTRAQPFRHLVTALQRAPSNLVVRPSALVEDQPPPRVDGLAAGSAVDRLAPPIPTLWHCPVYLASTPMEKNCSDMGCRACWLKPELSVSYHAH